MNNYEIQGFLGEGAYGIVLKAISKKTREVVAIKKFKDKDTENPAIKKVIVRELRALRGLKHPHIVELREAFKQSERLFLVFEFCEQSLLDLQNKSPDNRLSLATIQTITKEVLMALEHMHSRQMIHRDVKPENILITSDGRAKLCDFGFARTVKKEPEALTDYVATRWYRAPELLLSPRYDSAVDLWALGCVLGEMVDGDPLFPGENFHDQLRCIHRALGAFPPNYRALCFQHPEFSALDFTSYFETPKNHDPNFLKHRYLPKCNSPALVDLIEKLLCLDFRGRITAKEALDHHFFAMEKVKVVPPPVSKPSSSLHSPAVRHPQKATKENIPNPLHVSMIQVHGPNDLSKTEQPKKLLLPKIKVIGSKKESLIGFGAH